MAGYEWLDWAVSRCNAGERHSARARLAAHASPPGVHMLSALPGCACQEYRMALVSETREEPAGQLMLRPQVCPAGGMGVSRLQQGEGAAGMLWTAVRFCAAWLASYV